MFACCKGIKSGHPDLRSTERWRYDWAAHFDPPWGAEVIVTRTSRLTSPSSSAMREASSLVGRQREIGLVLAATASGRAVYVCGDAGSGVTSVCLAAAHSGPALCYGGALGSLVHVSYLALMRALRCPMPAAGAAGVAAFVRDRIGHRTLVLDDLQWMDPDTAAVLPLLAGRVALIAGVRNGEPCSPGAREVLDRTGFAIVELAALDESASHTLLAERRPALDAASRAAIISSAAGNPQALLDEVPGYPVVGVHRRRIAAMLVREDAATRAVLAVLGLIGRPAPEELFGPEVLLLLERNLAILENGLVRPRNRQHAEVAAAMLSDAERRRLHGALGRRLSDPGEAARHFRAAGDHLQAQECALHAAAQARHATERSRHLRFAVDCHADAGSALGPAPISAREREVLVLVGQGLTSAAIARQLRLSETTIDSHVKTAIDKLGASNRTQAAVLAATAS